MFSESSGNESQGGCACSLTSRLPVSRRRPATLPSESLRRGGGGDRGGELGQRLVAHTLRQYRGRRRSRRGVGDRHGRGCDLAEGGLVGALDGTAPRDPARELPSLAPSTRSKRPH
eukprot:2222262-Rhodomonas_salina.1